MARLNHAGAVRSVQKVEPRGRGPLGVVSSRAIQYSFHDVASSHMPERNVALCRASAASPSLCDVASAQRRALTTVVPLFPSVIFIAATSEMSRRKQARPKSCKRESRKYSIFTPHPEKMCWSDGYRCSFGSSFYSDIDHFRI